MRALFAALLVIAGCLGAAPQAPASPAALTTIELRGCTNLGADFPVPFADAAALLPQGFTPVVAQTLPQRTAQLYVIGLTCDDARVDGASVGAAKLGYEELEVTPPHAMRPADINDFTVPLLFAADPPALGDALARMHFGIAGAGTIERASTTPVDEAITVTLGSASFTLKGATDEATSALGAATFQEFGVQNATLATIVNATTTATTARSGVLVLQASGSAPLLANAQPAARGGIVGPFDYTLREVSAS